MGKTIFPTRDGDRHTYYNNAITYLAVPANQSRLSITDEDKDAVVALLTTWNEVFPKSQNPALKTKVITEQKDALIGDIEDALRDIYADIPESALTTNDRATFNLKERDTNPTARAQINDVALNKIKALEGARMEFTLRTDEDSSRASRHPLSDGAEIVYTIGTTAPTSPDGCTKTLFTSRAKGTFDVGIDNAGKKVYGYVRWKNNTDNTKSGPWSQMFTVVISD